MNCVNYVRDNVQSASHYCKINPTGRSDPNAEQSKMGRLSNQNQVFQRAAYIIKGITVLIFKWLIMDIQTLDQVTSNENVSVQLAIKPCKHIAIVISCIASYLNCLNS